MRKIFIILFTMCCVQNVFASYPPMPDRCPQMSAVENAGFNRVDPTDPAHHLWTVRQTNSYLENEETWSFAIENVEANTADEALTKAKAALPTLKIYDGPEEIEDKASWMCQWHDNHGLHAYAITPATADPAVS